MNKKRIGILLALQSVLSTVALLWLAIANHRLKRRLYQSLDKPKSVEIELKTNNIFEKNCQTLLTPAQTEVVTMANNGLGYKEIAKKRDTAENTIKGQMSSIGKILKVRTRANILKKLNSRIDGVVYI
ncbi:MAG: LuxR C-terminal-related transcriptional regulator [Sphingobacteriaceae bacterium]